MAEKGPKLKLHFLFLGLFASAPRPHCMSRWCRRRGGIGCQTDPRVVGLAAAEGRFSSVMMPNRGCTLARLKKI